MAEAETVTKPSGSPPPAQPTPEPAYTPPPPAPRVSVAEQARASMAEIKTGRQWSRPFRYTWAFAVGTIRGGLDGVAIWGQKGLKYGLVAGIIAGIAAPVGLGMAVLFGFAGATFLAAAVIGGAKGLLTEGYKAVGRIHRGEKYAEDLQVRAEKQAAAPQNRADYRAAAHKRKIDSGVLVQQVLERQAEANRDAQTYGSWQERVGGGNGHGRGY